MFKQFAIIFFLFPLFVFSQSNSSFRDLGFIEPMTDKLNVKFEIDNDIESFDFDDEITSYSIKPNTNLRTSISLNHEFLTLRIGYSPKFLEADDSSLKGNTKVFKINIDVFLNNWMQSFEYSQIKGYYIGDIVDPNDIFPDEDEFIILPNLKSIKISGKTRYKFNNNFSFKALLNQYDIQRKSAGSFVPSLTYGYFSLSDKTSIQDLQSYGFHLNAGYFYTFVINKKWYSSLGFSPGLGMEFNKLVTDLETVKSTENNNEFIFNINTHLSLGYNSKSFFAGLGLRGIATTRDENSIVKFNTVRGIVNFFVGYRFKSPHFVNQSFDWIEDQNPLK